MAKVEAMKVKRNEGQRRPIPPCEDFKALNIVEKPVPAVKKKPKDREAVAKKKTLALIKAWEGNEKSKAENKARKKICAIEAWENTNKATLEAGLKKFKEEQKKKEAEYVEKMKNEAAQVHKEAKEKKAIIEAKREEDLLKAEDMAAKYRANGTVP
ncbi:unnamed protein product [Fraxinus pennsylvanica]|uniref:Remorin C-terminal domain-containing protein n=1 Tax=Fraxinus pennsylvanica TaxID=56036 RepID=A0AAD1Z0H9_9LAMI|nr:unnamed protein product [Fraxinus pennsylvanica]